MRVVIGGHVTFFVGGFHVGILGLVNGIASVAGLGGACGAGPELRPGVGVGTILGSFLGGPGDAASAVLGIVGSVAGSIA